MKKILTVLVGLTMAISVSAEGIKTYFYYTYGSLKGQPVQHTGYLGLQEFGEACYVGNSWQARTVLRYMANDDIEKANVNVWLDEDSRVLRLSYVDVKCTDDSGYENEDEANANCRASVQIPACENE